MDSAISGSRQTPVAVAALLAALGVGLAVGLGGEKAGPALVVGVAAGVILLRPQVGMYLVAVTIPVETLLVLGEGFTSSRLLALVVVAGWGFQKLLRRESWRGLVDAPYFVAGSLFLGLVALSALWAQYVLPVRSGFIQIASLFGWSVVVIDLCRRGSRADRLAKALVLGVLVAATLTIDQYFVGGLRRAGEDVAGGVNGTAVVLVTLLPFSFYVLRAETRVVWRFLAGISIGASCIAVLVTFSRMNLLLLLPMLAVLVWHTYRGRTGRAWLTAILAVALLGALKFAPWEKVQERAETIAPYIAGTVAPAAVEPDEVSPRGYHLRVGLAIARDHPVLGAGYGNYGYLFRDEYQFQVAGAGELYQSPRSPHSSYIGILADLGIVGLVLWLSILWIPLVTLIRSLNLRSLRNRRDYILAQMTMYGLAVQVIAFSWYLPNQKEKVVWTLIGLGLALVLRAKEGLSGEPAPADVSAARTP